MATYSNYALRVPASLMADLRAAADRDGVSMNSFIVQAVAEKVAALRVRGMLCDLEPEEQFAYLEARAARGRKDRLSDVLGKAGTTAVALPGDELPEGWITQAEPTPEPQPQSARSARGAAE